MPVLSTIRNSIYGILLVSIIITSFIFSDSLFNGIITAKQLWFSGISALSIFIFGTDLLLSGKKFQFRINNTDIFLFLFYLYILLRSVFTPYTPLVYNIKFLNYTLLFFIYIIVRYLMEKACASQTRRSDSEIFTGLKTAKVTLYDTLIICLILTGLVQAIWGLLQLYGFARSFHSGFKITGTFFNPAPYALYLAAIFPLALGNIIGSDNKGYIRFRYYISLLTVLAIILVLPATMNRASWIGTAAGSVIILSYKYHLWDITVEILNTRYKRLAGAVFLLLFITLSGAGLYNFKRGSSEGRLLIWEITLGKIVEKPLFGYGTGRFEADYNNWQACYFRSNPCEMDSTKGIVAGNTKYCFNEYIEMTSELGFTGLLLFLGVLISLINGGFKRLNSELIVQKADTGNRISLLPSGSEKSDSQDDSVILLAGSLISLMVCAFISFPFYSLPTLIVMFIIMGMLSVKIYIIDVNLNRKETVLHLVAKFPGKFFSFARYIVIIILIAFSVFIFERNILLYKGYKAWSEAEMLYRSGIYGEACKSFSEAYPDMKYNGGYLQYYGKSLYMNEEYDQSVKILERARLFTSDEILFTSLGDGYKALNRTKEAKAAYNQAIAMVPHKLYPRYLLARLYKDTGQKDDALRTAQSILGMRIKVESTATNEIRKEMQEMITILTTNDNQ